MRLLKRPAGAWPEHEYRGTIELRVETCPLGPRTEGEVFALEISQYRLRGSDRPTTEWDDVELEVGQRHLYDGRRFHSLKGFTLEDLRFFVGFRSLPIEEQGRALRERLRGSGLGRHGSAAARDVFRVHPAADENAKLIPQIILRKEVEADDRLQWARTLYELRGPEARNACWRILDRGEPLPGEDPRLILHATIRLLEEGGMPPDDCSSERIRRALSYVKRNDRTRYMDGDRALPYHPGLDRLAELIAK